MRNRFVLSVLLLFAASGLLWAQFWKDYSDADRKKVGESYWLAGKQYQAVGKTEKGSEYMTIAKSIYPELDPSAIADPSMPSAAELLAQGRTTTIGAGAGSIPSGALNSFFLRFVSSLVSKDARRCRVRDGRLLQGSAGLGRGALLRVRPEHCRHLPRNAGPAEGLG